jgi:hypothetical protein
VYAGWTKGCVYALIVNAVAVFHRCMLEPLWLGCSGQRSKRFEQSKSVSATRRAAAGTGKRTAALRRCTLRNVHPTPKSSRVGVVMAFGVSSALIDPWCEICGAYKTACGKGAKQTHAPCLLTVCDLAYIPLLGCRW